MPPPAFKKPSLEVQIHGERWRAEVCSTSNSQHWKPLEEWKEQYEPPQKEDSEHVKKLKAHASNKAKTKVLQLMSEGISKKLLSLSLDVTSKLLTKAEEEFKGATASVVLPQLLNALNAIVLTFRFDKKGKHKKFAYLRRVACNQWTDLLLESASKAQSVATQCVDLEDELCETITRRQIDARVLASAMLNDMLATAKESAIVEQKLTQLSVVDTTTVDEVLTATGTKEHADEMKQEVTMQMDIVVDQFGAFLTNLVMSQMDQLTAALTQTMRSAFAKLEIALNKVNQKQAEVDEPHKEMYDIMEDVYSQLQDSVQSQVQMVVNMLETLMSNDEQEEE